MARVSLLCTKQNLKETHRNFAKNNAVLSSVRVLSPESSVGQVTGESLSFATNLIKLIFIHNNAVKLLRPERLLKCVCGQ